MVQGVKLLRIEIDPRFHITNESVVRPAVPQTSHHIEELARATVARLMLNMFLETKIHRLIRIARSHHVPASAPSTNVIKRSELPRDVIGVVISGRCGGDKPEMLGEDGERRQQC